MAEVTELWEHAGHTQPDRWASVLEAMETLEKSTRGLVRCAEDEVCGGLEVWDKLRGVVDRGVLALAVEAQRRGLHLETGLSLHDWMAQRCPGSTKAVIGDVVVLAKEWDTPGHQPVRAAVIDKVVTVARGAKMIRLLTRVRKVTDTATYQEIATLLVPVAAEGSDRDLARVSEHLLAVALPERETEAAARAARDLRGINESSLAGGTLTRFIITCDSEGAALIRSVLTSALAAPGVTNQTSSEPEVRSEPRTREDAETSAQPDDRPASDPGEAPSEQPRAAATVPPPAERDERTPAQRRYDAFMAILARGMSAPEGVPNSGRAKIFVTMCFDALAGRLRGAGHTFTGETLTPGQVRRLACEADLVPVVLGKGSEILDIGREGRLASPGQRKALWLRDQHCTFPGCTVPASWCDAHHADWWSRGGPTKIDNLALLCGRHHTIVHDKDLTATISATGVTWHV